jgi:hypothetical protein
MISKAPVDLEILCFNNLEGRLMALVFFPLLCESATDIVGIHVPTTSFGRTKETGDIISHNHTHPVATANCMLDISQSKQI